MSTHQFRAARARAKAEVLNFDVPVGPAPGVAEADPDKPDEWEYERFTMPASLAGPQFVDLAMEEAAGAGSLAWMAAVGRYLRAMLGDQFPAFMDACGRAGYDTSEIAELVSDIVLTATGRPTPPPLDDAASLSTGGIESTPDLSPVASTGSKTGRSKK